MWGGLAKAAQEAFESLLEIREKLPWPDPRGGDLYITIRPHDTESFLSKLEALNVEPLSTSERERRRREETANVGKGRAMSQEDALNAVLKMRDILGALTDTTESQELGFDVERRYYTPLEVDAVRAAVKELIVNVEREESREDGAEVTEVTSGEECLDALLSLETIPHRYVADGPTLAMAGQPEGRALAAFVLSRALQDERFRRRLDPLESSSRTQQPGEPEPRLAIASQAA